MRFFLIYSGLFICLLGRLICVAAVGLLLDVKDHSFVYSFPQNSSLHVLQTVSISNTISSLEQTNWINSGSTATSFA